MNNLPKKIIVIVFLLALFAELIWALVYMGKSSSKKAAQVTSDQNQENLRLSSSDSLEISENDITVPAFYLNPAKGNFKVGEVFPITIMVNSIEKGLSGADVVLFYDSQKLLPEEPFMEGTIFPDYPLVKTNKEKAKISITGTITDPNQQSFIGKGIFATVRFKTIAEGEAIVKFDFTPGSTADTNLTDRKSGKDVLERVINGKYTITR